VLFVVDKVALGQVFSEYFGFPLSISFHRCSSTRKRTKKNNNNNHRHLHHRVAQEASRSGASVASAAGPFTTKKKSYPDWGRRFVTSNIRTRIGFVI
jgi:hypothetical protein